LRSARCIDTRVDSWPLVVADDAEEIRKLQEKRKGLVSFAEAGGFDQDIYGSADQYDTSIATTEEEEEEEAARFEQQRPSYTAPSRLQDEVLREAEGGDVDVFQHSRPSRIADRENSYQARRRDRVLSPERADAFADQVRCTLLRTSLYIAQPYQQ
jgi:splicing factor 3B subunit 1